MKISNKYRVFDKYIGFIGIAIVSDIENQQIVLTYLNTGEKNFIDKNDLNYQPDLVFNVKNKIYLREGV